MKRLAVMPHVHVESLEDGTLIALEEAYIAVQGGISATVLDEVLAGTHARKEIVSRLKEQWGGEQVDRVIALMIEDGILRELAPELSGATLQRWHALPWPVDTISSTLRLQPVRLVNASDALQAALSAWGIRVVETASALTVVQADSFLDESLRRINDQHIESDQRWMLVKHDGFSAWCTLFIPGKTPCWRCLERALRENTVGANSDPLSSCASEARKDLGEHLVEGGGMPLSCARPDPSIAALQRDDKRGNGRDDGFGEDVGNAFYAEWVARYVVMWLLEESCPDLEGTLQVFKPFEMQSYSHPIRYNAGCGCRKGQRVKREDEVDTALRFSAKRAWSLEEAAEHAQRFLSPMTGVLRNLHPLPVPDARLGSFWTVQHAAMRQRKEIEVLTINAQARSIGKGFNELGAQVSALYEGIERYSGIWRLSVEHMRCRMNALEGGVVLPQEVLGFSDSQYRQRVCWNDKLTLPMLYVPALFDTSLEVDWLKVKSLVNGDEKWVPAALAFYDHPDAALGFAVCDSNGVAAGATPAEAIAGGLLECIERDAAAIWWYNRVPRPLVCLSEVLDPFVKAQEAAHRAMGRSLWVLDITTDTGVPVFVALSRNRADASDWAMGFGCHPNALRAVRNALLEVNQVVTVGQMHPATLFDGLLEDEDLAFLQPAPHLPPTKATDMPATMGSLKDLVNHLRGLGLDVLVINQTHPDLSVPVYRVITPGLAHHWRRLGCTRLYEVPVKLGWLAEARMEGEMNRVSLVL